jgi:hypothetical protein
MTRPSAAPRAPQPGGRITRLRLIAVVSFLASSLLSVILGSGERSGFVSMGQPGAWDFSESMLGYCYLHGAQPFMKENIPHVTQVGLFHGARKAQDLCEFPQEFRYLRGLYSFLGSLLTPPLDVITALLVVNWLCWAGCTWTAWRLTRDAFHSEHAAALAAVLTAGGIAMTAHIHDYSPHLLAFATYYVGVWVLYRSRVWRRRRPWRTHLRLGMCLLVASLAYNTGIMLTAAYVLTALRRNRLAPVFAAAAMGLTARPLWQFVLNMPAEDLDAKYLYLAWENWKALPNQDWYWLIRTPLRWLAECVLFFDSPLVVFLGLLACLVSPMSLSKRWFGAAVIGMPLLATFLIVPAASARGYIVASGAVWVYACLGFQASRGWASSRRAVRGATTGVMITLLAIHFLWSGAHLVRYWGPVKTYFLGLDEGRMYFLPFEVMSLTGQEPTPVLFGGDASLAEAGVYIGPQEHRLHEDEVSFWTGVRYGGFFVICLGLLLLAAGRTWRQRTVFLATWFGVYLVAAILADRAFRSLPAFFPVTRAIVLQPGDRIRLEVDLSPRFLEALRRTRKDGDQVVLYILHRRQEGLDIGFFAGATSLSVAPRHFDEFLLEADPGALDVIMQSRQLSMVVFNRGEQPHELGGWQRVGLAGRKFSLDSAESTAADPTVLPLCEVRLYSASGRLKLAGF